MSSGLEVEEGRRRRRRKRRGGRGRRRRRRRCGLVVVTLIPALTRCSRICSHRIQRINISVLQFSFSGLLQCNTNAYSLPLKLRTDWCLLPGADQLAITWSTGGQRRHLYLAVNRRQVCVDVNESRCQLGRLYLIAVDILPKSSIDIWVDDEGRMPRTIKTDNEVLRVRKL